MIADLTPRGGVRVGDAIPAWDLSNVSAEKMKTLAPILQDSNPIHFDVDVVRALGLGDRPVNQGPSNMAYVMNMLASWSGSHRHLRRLTVRFRGNVLGNDHVIARGQVTDLRSEDGCVLAECEVELVRSDGEVTLQGSATVDVTVLRGDATVLDSEHREV